jgi:SulP family sulfate permease
VFTIVKNTAEAISTIRWECLLLSIVCILALFFYKKTKRIPKWIPAEIVVLTVSIVASYVANMYDMNTLSMLGPIPSGLPVPSIPSLFDLPLESAIVEASSISLVSYIGSVALAKTFAFKHGTEINPNQELLAQGIANAAGSFFQGHPVSGSFTRTAVNDEMGAQTPLASAMTSLVVIFSLFVAAPALQYLPKLVLASMVSLSVRNLIEWKELVYLYRARQYTDFVIFLGSFVFTLTLGVSSGIILSIGISILAVIWRSSRPKIVTLGQLPGTFIYRNVKRYPTAILHPGIGVCCIAIIR